MAGPVLREQVAAEAAVPSRVVSNPVVSSPVVSRGPADSGFSMIELLVVLAMLGIVTSQILSVLSTQLKSYAGQKAITETQGDARLAVDLMLRDLRMAGFMVPATAAVSGNDGGVSAADTLCASDPNVMNDVQVDLAMNRFAGASLTASATAGDNSVTVATAALDIDGDGDGDFAVGNGIIIASSNSSHCALITAISSGTLSFSPVAPTGLAIAAGAGVAVPAIYYARTSAGLVRNSLVVSRQIEDLQVQYAVDANDDGQISGGEFPINALSGQNPGLMRRLRLSLITRTIGEDPHITGTGRQAVANRNASGTPDAFRRRLVTVAVAPRNLL